MPGFLPSIYKERLTRKVYELNLLSHQFHVLDAEKANLGWIATFTNASHLSDVEMLLPISGLCSASSPKQDALTFVQSERKLDISMLSACRAVITNQQIASKLPDGVVPIIVDQPHSSFASVARALFPNSLGNARESDNDYEFVNGAHISRSASLERDVVVEPGAVIGAGVAIGRGTYVGANATIGSRCQIGRNCSIGASASIQYSLIGDHVTLHVGTRIGQDGFGFVPEADGLKKMPQLGRVIIQDNVEIGANTTVDRGTLDDTVIGEGTKIDNLVQIGHNVIVGRNCAIAAFVGLSGSCRVGDGCLIGGRVGIADHVTVGDGVQLAATSSVMNDIPSGERWAGTPAQPFKAFFREQATLRRMAKPNKTKND